ncbi:MAG: hypothetical protein LBF23_00500 [Endomicrobium sp.]|nr:hypothetical protein [Endomicrobium sp.]
MQDDSVSKQQRSADIPEQVVEQKEQVLQQSQQEDKLQEEKVQREETAIEKAKPEEVNNEAQTQTTADKDNQEQTSQTTRADGIEKSTSTSETVKKIAEALKEDGQEDKNHVKVVEEIAKQTGLSKEEVEAELAKLDKTQRKGVIAALANLFGEGKDIIYCVADVLGTVLDATSKGLLAFQAILADAIAGIFVKNNQALIKGESSQLLLSAQAIQTVLAKYGKDYTGINANVDEIISNLNAGESAIIHVGGNHFITITKNEDGTFTKTDINKSPETLTVDELKSAMQAQYGLKESETTTVLVKEDKDNFKSIKRVNNLAAVLGAEIQWDNSKFDSKSQQDYYKAYGEKSYEMLMRKLYGDTPLSSEQSREFTAFYKNFLEKSILELDKELNDDKTSQENKEKAKALKAQAAKELAITNAVGDYLKEHSDGIISGQPGQVLLTGQKIDTTGHPEFEQGKEYYEVVTFYADALKTQISIKDKDDRTVSIPKYRISNGKSISTKEGVTVTRSDDQKYQVFGVPGKYGDIDVAFEYRIFFNKDGTFVIGKQSNIYLLNDKDKIYQQRRETGSKPPTSGMYAGGVAPERENWTHGIITETETGYVISGAGSRITIKQTDSGWMTDAIGIGTEAMAGSKLRMAANDPDGKPAVIYLNIENGFMVNAGNYWVPSDGFVWNFDKSVSQKQIEDFMRNTLTTQFGLKSKDIEGIDFFDSDGHSIFCPVPIPMTYKEWEDSLVKAYDKKHPALRGILRYDKINNQAGLWIGAWESKRKEKYEEYKKQYIKDYMKDHDYTNRKMLGAPFATETMLKAFKVTANIKTKAGFTYDTTKAGGDICRMTIDTPSVLEVKLDKNDSLAIYTTQDIKVTAIISEPGWEFDNRDRDLSAIIKKGQLFSLATILYNTDRKLINTTQIEMITGYEITGNDGKGNNYYDYTKPKYSKIAPGTFRVKGNADGKYALVNNIHITIGNGNWNVVSQSGYNNISDNKAIWKAGAEISISKKDKTFNVSIIKGDLEVTNLTVTFYKDPNTGGGDDSNDKYKGPTIDGAYIVDHRDLGNNMHSYKIQSGTFKGVSGDQATQNSLGNFLFVPGSDFKKGSIIQADGTKAKYNSKIKDDGSIDAYGAKWYEKLRDGFIGFFSILAMALMTIFTLGALIWAKDMKGMSWAKEWAAITYGYWNNVEADGSNADAVKKGMDLAKSGLGAVAILVIAAVSIVSAIFTGGASIAAGIAAIVGIVGAIAGAVSAINLTYSAIQAFRAGKTGMGLLMVFFALLTVVLSAVGAGQIGSAIGSGLVKVGAQFFIKMGIGAAIGAVAGAAVSAASQGIIYGIRKRQGKVDEFDWNEFGKEVGIGALTGAFAGAAVGAQIGAIVAKNTAKVIAEQVAKGIGEASKNVGKEVGEEVGRIAGKEIGEAIGKESSKLVGKDLGEKVGAAVGKSIGKEIGEDISAQITQSLTKAVSFEVGEEAGKNVAKEVAEEVAKNVVEDLTANVVKNLETNITQALSGKVSKEVAEKVAKSVSNKVAASLSKSLMSNLAGNVAKMTTRQIFREMFLGGTSFTKQAGQTTLQFAGQCIKSGLTVVGRVGMLALSGYISYMSAKSFVDSIESGDFMGAIKALYTLVSINIVMPLMSAQSAIKEGGTLKASDFAAKENSAASKGMEAASEGIRGWKIVSTAITTAVGAGIGMALAAIIAKVNGKEISSTDLITGAMVGGAIGSVFGILATKADWTALGNSVKTSFAKTIAPFGGKTAQFARGVDGTIVIKGWNNFSGATMARAWGGLVGGGALGVAIGAGIWAAKGQKKEDMAKYLIIGGVAGGLLGAGIGNAFSTGAYQQAWQNFKANPQSIVIQLKQYIQESLSKSLMMVHSINIFNTYMAYTTGILNQIYYKMTGDSLANTDIVKFINNVTGMGLFKSEADKEADAERERKKKKTEKKGEEFDEKDVVYKAEFGKKEANAVINQNWESLTGPMMHVGTALGGFLKPILGPALQHSPILGSVMGVMESAGQISIMQQNKTISMFYTMGVKIRILNIISKQIFDDPNTDEDDQFAELMSFAFLQMFEAMPLQEQTSAEKFLTSGQEITKTVDGKQIKVELGKELYDSAILLKNSNMKAFEANLRTVCTNLGLNESIVSQYVKFGMSYNEIVGSLLSEYALNGFVANGALPENIAKLRADLNKIVQTSSIIKRSSGLSNIDAINSISAKINYLDSCAKILELNIEGISRESLVDALANGTLTKAQYTKILQAQDAQKTASGVRLLMNYLSGIDSLRTIPINDLISAVVEYNNSLATRTFNQDVESSLKDAAIKAISELISSMSSLVEGKLNLSPSQISKIIEIIIANGTTGTDCRLTPEALKAINEVIGDSLGMGTMEFIGGLEAGLKNNTNLSNYNEYINAFENTYSPGAKITLDYMRAVLQTSVVAKYDTALTKALMRSLEKQSFRAGSYLAYTAFKDMPQIKDVKRINELRNTPNKQITAEQTGELELLEAKYLPSEISFFNAVSSVIKEVEAGKLSYEELNLVLSASDIVYSKLTTPEVRAKLKDYRLLLRGQALAMSIDIKSTLEQLKAEGTINEAGAREILNKVYDEYGKMKKITANEVGNVSSFMFVTLEARSMLSSIRSSNILPVVTTDGKALTFDSAKQSVAINSVENTAKGMKVNITVKSLDGNTNIFSGDVIFKNNLNAITNNKAISQAIAEKFPNMLASDLALNAALPQAVKTVLTSLNQLLNLSEIKISKITEVALTEGSFGPDNKLTPKAQKAIQDIVGTKVVANLVIRNIESTRLDLKVKLQNILSTSDALVSGSETFRLSADGKQVKNEGYILSSSARAEITKLVGEGNAKLVIDSIESTLNTQRVLNQVKTFKNDPSQLIKLCSANANPTAISALFSYLSANITTKNEVGEPIEMSMPDLAILCDNIQNGVTSQVREMLKSNKTDKEITEKLKDYLKDPSRAEEVVQKIKSELESNKDIKDADLHNKVLKQYLDLGKVVDTAIKDIDALKKAGKLEDQIRDDINLKSIIGNSGYPNADALLPRLNLLKGVDQATGKIRLELIQEKFYDKGGYLEQASKFIEENAVKDGNKIIKLKSDVMDKLRAKALTMQGEDAVNFLRITLNECMKGAVTFGVRASQSELITTLQNDTNAALGMGGGKTVSLALDAAMQRVLMGNALNLEILVGNSDLGNYVGEKTEARKFFDFIGMKAVSINDFKPEGGQTNVAKLKEAYQDPNVVVIMDPTMRGHMMNEAVSRGGLEGAELRSILQSVNRVTVDEVHLWALTKTAAVVGGDNRPPDSAILKKATAIADLINAKDIYNEIAKKSTIREVSVTIQGQKVLVQRFANNEEFNNNTKSSIKGEYIAVIGQQTASLEIKMSNGIRDVLLNKIGSAFEGYTPSGMLNSMLRGLFASSDNGGMALGSDGKVKPVGAKGVEENMVIGDIYQQLGYSMRTYYDNIGKSNFAKSNNISADQVTLEMCMSRTTQMSSTSMQTSLAAIYSGANARMVGISGTVAGLQQLIINRTGSGRIYNITGESVDPSMFNSVKESTAENLSEKISSVLKEIRAGNLPKDALDNVLMLGKTQATIEVFRVCLTNAIQEIGGFSELTKMGIEIFEFTDKQGKWTNEKGDVTSDLGKDMKTISDVAKNKNIKRIIIANEMGATGVDYQGNYLNIIADAHLMSNTDLAQALKRTARPNSSFGKEGGLQRWTTNRVIMLDKTKAQAELRAFAENPVFVEYAKQLWSGVKAGGNMVDSRSVKWLEVMEKGNFDLENSAIIEGLYKLSSAYKGGPVDVKNDEVKNIAMKEAITFISKIQDLRSVDSSIRFAINDSIRDRMVLSVLRNVVASLPEGKAKQAAQAELNDALKNNSSISKDIFEVNENMKAESPAEVMRKAFDNSAQEAQQRFTRLQDVLKKFGADTKVANQLEVMENHLESIRIAMSNASYYNSKPITNKGLGDAIDMTEFMQIIRSFEEYIMPMATVVDRAETIRTEKSIQDTTSKAVREYVKNDNTLSRENEQGERVLTPKGELFIKMMEQEVRWESITSSGAKYAWLANKLGASYTPLSADLNLAEQTKRQIENVKNLVDKLVEVNKDMKYEAVKEFFILQQEEENRNKEYKRAEIVETLNRVNKEYIDELAKINSFNSKISDLKKEISGNNESIVDLEQTIAGLEQELNNYSEIADEGGLGDELNNIESNILDMKNILKAKQELQRIQNQLDRQVELFKEAGYDIEVSAGTRVEELIISQGQNRVQEALDKDASLSKRDKNGNRVLTQKGKIYAKVAKELVGGNKDFASFLMKGPLGKLGFGDKIKAKMEGNNGEIKYEEDLVKEITEALWGANIWEYSQIEKLYGFYELIAESERGVLNNMSLADLKGLLSAQHRQAIKGLAEQKGYNLPDAEVVALAKLTKGMKFEGNEALGKYFGKIVKSYEDLEVSAAKMTQISNEASQTSKAGSGTPGFLKGIWSGMRSLVKYVTSTKWELAGVSESVDISLEEAVKIVGKDREKAANLLYFAGKVDSTTQEALDNFDTLVKNIPNEQVGKFFKGNVNMKKVAVTAGLAVGAIALVVLAGIFFPAVGPLAMLGAGAVATIGAVSGLGVVGGLAALGQKFKIFNKIMPRGDYYEKLKISEINKFAKLKTFSKLIVDGKIDLNKEEDMGKISSKKLYEALNATKAFGEVISDEEARLIVGQDYKIIKNFKEDQIEEKYENTLKGEEFEAFKEANKKKEGESDKDYQGRLDKLAKSQAEMGFKWDISSIASVMNALDYEKGSKEQEKLFVVLLGDANIKSSDMVKRYGNVIDIASRVDSNVDIKVLQEYKMFNEDNSVSNEFILKYVIPVALKSVNEKFKNIGYKGANAGQELVGKMGVGITKAEELNVAIAQTLALFESTGAMQEYLGIDLAKNAYTKEEIASAAFRTYKEALKLFAEGEMDKAGLEQETTIIRTVSEMLMVAIEKPELAEAINERDINNEGLETIERLVNIESTKVNRFVFVDALREEVKASSSTDEMVFEINIEDLKKGLESKEALVNIGLPKEINELLPALEGGRRGKKHKTMLMEIRNARAVSQAA